jgi:squalene-hopene/tetraprenyl-beta-curcumene cyclase
LRNKLLALVVLPGLCLVAFGIWRFAEARRAFADPTLTYRQAWSPPAAAAYLDQREVWWQSWPPAQEDRKTVCISCHTVVPYALARPLLRASADRQQRTPEEQAMLASVEKRVSNWANVAPFYTDGKDGPGKTAQSRATEAVLNAVILASYDAEDGHLSPLTRAAFDDAWVLQLQTGADAGGWQWEDFDLAPWESSDSCYQGAAMLAIAVSNLPGGYALEPAIAPHIALLQQYLRRLYPTQPLMSQLYVLWASARMPSLITGPERSALLRTLASLQHPDGGWTLASLDERDTWKGLGSPPHDDGLATALAALALENSGSSRADPMLKRGLRWLSLHQETNGSWYAASLNKLRNPRTDVGLFMSDAATGYAVMALEAAKDDAAAASSRNAE